MHDRVLDLISRIDDKDKPNLMTARGRGGDGKHMQAFPELGVPAYYWGTNCLHSLNSGVCVNNSKGELRCPINFPGGPSFGAMFDRGMIRNMSTAIGKELRAMFILRKNPNSLDCWGPVINLNRDPRWGRNGEGGLEDAYAMGELAKAWTIGFQSPRPSKFDPSRQILQAVITIKHMVANSLENTAPYNRHNFDANSTYGVDPFVVSDFYLRPFKSAIQAGARGIMCSYNAVMGVPTCLSPMVRDARKQWGFEGYVTSDSDSVENAWHDHHFVKTKEEATALALTDGQCDVDSGDTYNEALPNAVAQGTRGLKIEDVDRALYNALKQRFDLGLFDPEEAYDWPTADDVGTDASVELNLKASQSALVLLRNDDRLLPLSPGKRIAVIGPHADATAIMSEPYAFHPLCADRSHSCIVSPFAAIKAINNAAGGSTELSLGCDLFDPSESGFAAALDLAMKADVVVLGLGIETCGFNKSHNVNPLKPGKCYGEGSSDDYVFPDEYLELEAHDRLTIDLPAVQHRLAAKVLELGKPTVLFLMHAGAVAIDDEASYQGKAPMAIVEAFYPGTRGGEALAQGLFGLHNRWGRMPYTIYPKKFESEALMTEHDIRLAPGRTYRYYPTPTFAFGHGLTLTTWSLTADPAPCLTQLSTATPKQVCPVSLKLTNTGNLTGDSVLMAYFRKTGSQDKRWTGGQVAGGRVHMPQIRQLFDFQRLVDVMPGFTETVVFDVAPSSLAEADEPSGDWGLSADSFSLIFEDGGGASVEMDAKITGDSVVLDPFPGKAEGEQQHPPMYI